MGKSPGKWIKTVLFGKKNSKSQFSKNVTPGKRAAARTAVEDPAGDSLEISNPSQIVDRGSENIQLENASSGTPCVNDASFPVDQDADQQSNIVSIPLSDAEKQRQDEAAAKAQAAFRGYLARRAFRALKGIIRLQALIRGHLVRRQAVATLHCMQAIVKLQALARGQKDAKLVVIGAETVFRSEKLATNLFLRKLLVSLPTAMPLTLQYDLAEPNSARNWLERWSISHLWESPSRTKKSLTAKSHRKPAQIVEPDSGKSRRTIRKVSAATNGDNGDIASVETDKPKRIPRKISQTESVQEHPQTELERVKRSLKKVSATAAVATEKSETEPEKPKTITNAAVPDVPEQVPVYSSDQPAVADVVDDSPAPLEDTPKIKIVDEQVEAPLDDHAVAETHSSENGEKIENSLIVNEEVSVKDEELGKENQKIRKRRSLPAKQEYAENISQNTPSLPSYMAATESAKAKLRAQAAAKIAEDAAAEYNQARRHSLPAATNGKLTSLSPRIQKPVQANGKVGSKVKPMTASRDDKGLQPGWRR